MSAFVILHVGWISNNDDEMVRNEKCVWVSIINPILYIFTPEA